MGSRIKALVGLVGSMALMAVDPAAGLPPSFAEQADSYLESAYPADGPGAAVIVTEGGRPVYLRGRGLADVEAGQEIRPETVFRLGSITKQFTAAVVLQLAQEGRLSLDDPLSRFFPDYPQPGAEATVRQLLDHTSGIRSYTSIREWMTGDNFNRSYTTAEMIAVFRGHPSPSAPGEVWTYNNSGYILLGGIIEAVTGMPWHEAVVERISRPLGLATIGYGESAELRAVMARGYTGSEEPQPAIPIHMSVPHGAGGLAGSVTDLARWAAALHEGRVVSPSSYREMIQPVRLPDGSVHPYGFGLRLENLRGRQTIGHGGGIFGFNTDSIYVPSANLFIAVLANSDSPATAPELVARRLAALALGDPFPSFSRADVDQDSLEPLFGVYRSGSEGNPVRRFFARSGQLYTQQEGEAEREVFAAGGDRFFYGPESLAWFRIERGADATPLMLMYRPSDAEPEQAVRRGPIPTEAPELAIDPDLLRSYVGSYVTPGPGVTVAMRDDGRLTIQLTDQEPLELRAVAQNEFEVAQEGARVVFHMEEGEVNRLTIRQGGRELPGRRAEP